MSDDGRLLLPKELQREGDTPTKIEQYEFRQIQLRRYRNLGKEDPPTEQKEQDELFPCEDPQHERDLVGLAFSGGGIRSATFNLGFLQGLAETNLLRFVDYLSTVSGGGYIGSWFTTWVKREGSLENVALQMKTYRTSHADATRGFTSDGSFVPKNKVLEAEPEPIHHLRQYSNYLAPRLGVFSSDAWALLAVYLRNLVANLLVFLPAVLTIFLLIRIVAYLCTLEVSTAVASGIGAVAVAGVLASFLMIVLSVNRLKDAENRLNMSLRMAPVYFGFIVGLITASSALLTWLLVPTTSQDYLHPAPASEVDRFNFWLFDSWNSQEFVVSDFLQICICFAALHGVSGIFRGCSKWRSVPESPFAFNHWWPMVCGILSGALGGALLYVVLSQVLWPCTWNPAVVVTFGPPWFIFLFVGSAIFEVSLLGTLADEREREWWNQLIAWLMVVACVWIVLCGTALFAPLLLYWLNEYVAAGVGFTWVTTAAGGLWAARSSQTNGENRKWSWKELVSRFAPYVFLLGLFFLMSLFVHFCLTVKDTDFVEKCGKIDSVLAAKLNPDPTQIPANVLIEKSRTNNDPETTKTVVSQSVKMQVSHWSKMVMYERCLIAQPDRPRIYLLAICGIILAFTMSCRVDINEFSLNAMYANRLTRCYLGASRRKASKPKPPENWATASGAPTHSHGPEWFPNRITGFDSADDIALTQFQIGVATTKPRASQAEIFEDKAIVDFEHLAYWGPFPILNSALNLVAGDELAWQDRKAESYILTPLFCGNTSLGYCPTEKYAGGSLTLGRAIAISGAAANPNMGYHSAPATAAMMTLFNVRLGWWLPNPKTNSWLLSRPWFLLKWLAIELFSQTNANRKFLNISDGGHFENLGVYELIRRRCRCVIVTDCGADPNYQFEDVAALIRKCRTDFGVEIEINLESLRPNQAAGKPGNYCAVGTIRYDRVEPTAAPGVLLLIKPLLTGKEPPDVAQYAQRNESFPQQPTLDQFFDESQFEAYRALGHYIALDIFKEFGRLMAEKDEAIEPSETSTNNECVRRKEVQKRVVNTQHEFVVNFIWNMQKSYLNAPESIKNSLLESVDPFVSFHKELSQQKSVSLSHDLYGEFFDGTADPKTVQRDLHAAVQMLQVMENAWLTMDLQENHAHPLNAGWMNLLQRWTKSTLFRRHWYILRHEFSRNFVTFCEQQLAVKCPVKDKLVEWSQITLDEQVGLCSAFQAEWLTERDHRSLTRIIDRALSYRVQDSWQKAIWCACLEPEFGLRRVVAGVVGLSTITEANLPPASRYQTASVKQAYLLELLKDWNDEQDATRKLNIQKQIEQLQAELRSLPQVFELVAWVRPEFRGQRIGQLLIEQFFETKMWSSEGPKLLGRDNSSQERKLIVVYPKSGWAGRGDKLAKKQWLSCFSFYDFRRPKPEFQWPQLESYELLESNCHWRE